MIRLKRQQPSLITLLVLGWLTCAGTPITVSEKDDLDARAIVLAVYSTPIRAGQPAERLPRLERGAGL